MIDHSLPPDQRRHAPALSVTAVGKEAQRIRVRAPVTAEHRAHPGGAEPAPGERAEIALPAAAAVGAERLRRGSIVRQEGGTHFAPNLEVCRTDGRAQPGDEAPRPDGKPPHRPFHHPPGQPAPPARPRPPPPTAPP